MSVRSSGLTTFAASDSCFISLANKLTIVHMLRSGIFVCRGSQHDCSSEARTRTTHCDECGSSAEHACWNSGPKLYPFRPSDATNSGAEAIRGKTHFSAGGQWEWPHRFRSAFSVSRPLTGSGRVLRKCDEAAQSNDRQGRVGGVEPHRPAGATETPPCTNAPPKGLRAARSPLVPALAISVPAMPCSPYLPASFVRAARP